MLFFRFNLVLPKNKGTTLTTIQQIGMQIAIFLSSIYKCVGKYLADPHSHVILLHDKLEAVPHETGRITAKRDFCVFLSVLQKNHTFTNTGRNLEFICTCMLFLFFFLLRMVRVCIISTDVHATRSS